MGLKCICIGSFLGLFVFYGCRKSEGFDCFKRTGKISTQKRDLPDFNILEVHNNMQVFLIQDTLNYILLEGGENLLPAIETRVENKTLFLKNKNTCNFTRSYKKKIKVFVHLTALHELLYKASGPVSSLNTLQSSVFTFNSWDGTDTVKLQLQADTVFANIHTGVADLMLTGSCRQLYTYTQNSGVLRLQNFNCKRAFARNISTGNQYLWVENELDAHIQYSGSIYYKGNPAQVSQIREGSGKLIKID